MVKVNIIEVEPAAEGKDALPRRRSRRLGSTRGLSSNILLLQKKQVNTEKEGTAENDEESDGKQMCHVLRIHQKAAERTQEGSDAEDRTPVPGGYVYRIQQKLEAVAAARKKENVPDPVMAKNSPPEENSRVSPEGNVSEGQESLQSQKNTEVVSWQQSETNLGWVRVFLQEEDAAEDREDAGTLVYLTRDTTVRDICRHLNLTDQVSLWIQYGGGTSRRMAHYEKPLHIQDDFLATLGYTNPERRARLGIDPELQHLLRFHVGPASPSPDLPRSGYVLVLKGLVFPQWRRRPLAIMGSRLFLYPGSANCAPEMLQMSGGEVEDRPSRAGRMVLRLAPRDSTRQVFLGFNTKWERDLWKHWLSQATQLNLGSETHLDLTESGLERLPESLPAFCDLEVLQLGRNRLGNGKDQQERTNGDPHFEILCRLPRLRVLQLQGNNITTFPPALMRLPALMTLDLSDNGLTELPQDGIHTLANLEELRLDRNSLTSLPRSLTRLPRLRILLLAYNKLVELPAFLSAMRALNYLDVQGNRVENPRLGGKNDVNHPGLGKISLRANLLKGNIILGNYGEPALSNNGLEAPTTEMSSRKHAKSGRCSLHLGRRSYDLECLRAPAMASTEDLDYRAVVCKHKQFLPALARRRRTGHLRLRLNISQDLHKIRLDGNPFKNLTQLDVSENSIETLDLSALSKLECIQCSKNRLAQLTLNGKALTSLIAGNNRLKKLLISPSPMHLKHLDVSYNELEALPDWISSCNELKALFASHNKLRTLPDHLFCSELSSLQTLQLSYNYLQALPEVIHHIPLQELFLQSNCLATLPSNFFSVSTRLRVLNLSNNRLCSLPIGNGFLRGQVHQLEKLYLTANCLCDNTLDVLGRLTNLHTLHAAYNSLTTLPESCIAVWKDLEELVLSGNKLQYLPDNIVQLKHLRVLRVHSNHLQTIPCFSRMTSLKVLDLAHNCLDRVNLATLVPQQLQFLDLSCNSKLYVDPRQFQMYRTNRPMSLVDVSGKNRTCLPSTPCNEGGGDVDPPWKIGFSETAGHRERLYITQIRLPAFCNTEGLFGIFDGGNNNEIPNALTKAIPRMLLEERTLKETANEYMKYTMLSAHRELKEKGQRYGVCGTLCHIVRSSVVTNNGFMSGGQQHYILRVASVGEAQAVLCRHSEPMNLSQETNTDSTLKKVNRSQLGCSAMFPLVVPDPYVSEVYLGEEDEFLIIANKRFWEVVSMKEAVEEIQDVNNPILAAKRLQDIAQSYGSEENLSVLVVRFQNLNSPSDVEHIMRELRNTIRKTKSTQQQCQCGGCCCGTVTSHHKQTEQNGFQRDLLLKQGVLKQISNESWVSRNQKLPGSYDVKHIPEADRSSPSGQSDQANSDCLGRREMSKNRLLEYEGPNGNHRTMPLYKTNTNNASVNESFLRKVSSTTAPSIERRSYRDSKRSNSGVLKAIRNKMDAYNNGHLADGEEEETASDHTQVSDEQFKCWEYMLEKNTQMLFDKELNTLSRGFTRHRAMLADPLWGPFPTNASLKHHNKTLSRSSPHLSDSALPPAAPFLSRQYGSARSFNPPGTGRFGVPRFGSGRYLLNGGPNAAYFGSLQRLMPYNLEYNFSIIQERANQDSLEHDNRMQQYWDVTTTEL